MKKPIAIILAAGIGSRLRPHTEDRPKCLVEVAPGVPILREQLEALSRAGIEEIFLVVGYRDAQIKAYVEDWFPHLEVRYIRNPFFETHNTLHSLALASERLPGGRAVLQLNGDVVFDAALIPLLLEANGAESLISARVGACAEEEIKIVLAADGAIRELSKKVDPTRAYGEGVGVNFFDTRFWNTHRPLLQSLGQEHPKEYFEFWIERAVNKGAYLRPFPIGALYAKEIDTVADLEEARLAHGIKIRKEYTHPFRRKEEEKR